MAELKYVIFFMTLIFGVPIGYSMSKKNPLVEKIVFFLMIFFTCHEVTINFISHEFYRGTSKGYEISLVDVSALIIFFLVITSKNKIRLLPTGSLLYFAYFFFSLISLVNSDNYLYSSFEIWKMIRMYFYFWTFYNYINSFKKLDLLIKYYAAILIYIFYVVLKQKYLMGMFQTKGPFPHQNSLVMYNIILCSFILAYLLNNKKAGAFVWMGIFGTGGISIISTLSRAGMACFFLSIIIVMMLTFSSGFSMKKIGITFVFILIGAGVLFKAMDSIIERFSTAPKESAEVRVLLAEAAVKMAGDKTFGVGLNNFGFKINHPYPYGDHIPGRTEETKGGLVETIYLMIAAETGWHNLFIFIVMLLYFYFINVINFVRLKKSDYRFVSIALCGGLAGIYLESSLEWVLKQTNNFYQLMMVFAVTGAVSRLIKEEKRRKMYAGKIRI